MPDPPRSHDFDHVAHTDTKIQQRLSTPGVVISPGQNHGSRNSASDEAARRISNYDPNTDFAYGANPSSDTVLASPAYASSSANRSLEPEITSVHHYSLANHSTNAEVIPNLNFAPFGSQPWPSTSAPYIDFAPQPLYEPTGELVREAVQGFEHFDDPTSFRQPVWPTNQEGIAAPPTSTINAASSTAPSPVVAKDGQNFPKPALKRSLESESGTEIQQFGFQQQRPSHDENRKVRRVSFEHMSGTAQGSADDEDSSSSEVPSISRQTPQARHTSSARRGRGSRGSTASSQRSTTHQTASTRSTSSAVERGSKNPTAHPPSILPPEKVFPIQIGSELFKLSGASISSDAPSYFTQFFEAQIKQNEESGGVRTLYIDRDPETFRDVARHLQGYYIKPRDGSHFVKLFADAQFYSLPRLIDQLFEAEIFIQIGERHFQIPKDIFSDPGNSPNFFSLGFAVFFSTPSEVFPGLDRRGLLRPPSITPPYVPGRSADIFGQLLHLLRGYSLHIKNEEHRTELLRDCRYFHLRGLEQKIIAHEISYNLERQQSEICLRIEDIKPSGISYKADDAENEQDVTGGWVRYARPFVDDKSFELIVEIGGETTVLDLDNMRLDLHGLTKARISSLFQVVANKMNLPTNAPLGAMMLSAAGGSSHASPGHTPLSEDRVKVLFEPASDILLDGTRYDIDWSSPLGQCMSHGPSKSNDDTDDSDAMSEGKSTEKSRSPQRPRARVGRQLQTQGDATRPGFSMRLHGTTNAPPPRLETAGSTSRKRRRPTVSTASNNNGHGEWTIRTGQWRLRVQQSENDPIRGGYEIIFMAVKVDAFSQERARNARRKFLGSG